MTPARPFVPWALPAAAGMVAGVASCAWQGPATLIGWALLLALALALGGRRRLLLVALLAGGVGAGRYALWQSRPDRLAALLGGERLFTGESDGRTLRLVGATRSRLALAPAGSVPSGRVTVKGRAVRAEAKRNPGGFDERGYLARRGIAGRLLVSEVVAAWPRRTVLERFRAGAAAGLPPPQAALMEAMTLGVRDDLGDLRATFAAAGLAHVLALSGLHVGVLMAALARLAAGLGRRRYPLLAAATVGYVLLVGPSPSVLRAGSMVLAGLAGLAAGYGRIQPWPSLSLAALVSLSLAPAQLLDASFQLSYLAVIGMLLLAPPLLRRLAPLEARWREAAPRPLKGVAGWALPAMVASAAAQIPSLSLVAGSFGLVPLGFAAAVLGLALPGLAALLNHVTGLLAALLLMLAGLGAKLPHLAWAEVAPLGHACFAIAATALALWLHGHLRAWRALLVALCAGGTCLAAGPAQGVPEVIFLDVGQGDATLIRLPGRVEVLVDGGGTPFSDADIGARVVLPALRALGVRALDVVVATHADLDHVEGLATVLRRMPVGTLVMGPVWPSAAIDGRLRAIAAARGIPVHRALRGERWRFGRGRRGAEIDVLHPLPGALPTSNENSVALLLRYAGAPQVLMLGDAPASVERTLAVPHVPVLKVAHHGSRFSSSEALLRAAHPALAVVSVGANHYGHPDPGVLERLSAIGAAVSSTREAGAIRLPMSPRGPGPATTSVQDGLLP